MKKETLEIQPQFILDQNGKKTGVILDIKTFEDLLEKIEDLYFGSLAHQTNQDKSQFHDFQAFKKNILK